LNCGHHTRFSRFYIEKASTIFKPNTACAYVHLLEADTGTGRTTRHRIRRKTKIFESVVAGTCLAVDAGGLSVQMDERYGWELRGGLDGLVVFSVG
jgi:hypothetical protein